MYFIASIIMRIVIDMILNNSLNFLGIKCLII
ncbi:MAG: hypothetical protein CM15mP75_2060 [Flammeovirgaceae bacterium]|nr:MAG: hypothetical protein CM15mP75_2060 [Flammeovirgaceae bacterium]